MKGDEANRSSDPKLGSESDATIDVKPFVIILLVVMGLFLASLTLPLIIDVWPPDVVSGRLNIVAEEELPNGDRFSVVQYWDLDFYTTELRHTLSGGKVITTLLERETDKCWNAAMKVDVKERYVQVVLKDGEPRRESWEGELAE